MLPSPRIAGMLDRLLSRRGFARGMLGLGTAMPALAATCCPAQAAETPPTVAVPGAPQSTKHGLLEQGAAILQGKDPLTAMNMYLNGFHFYADDLGRQVEAHHFCTALNDDVHQCVIFDSNGKDARLIGVEYIVSERLFRQLPDDEKPLWHSHHHEVKSGALVMPGIPGMVEKEAMEMLVTTYGKTWHTWQVDRGDRLPYGIPQLMMGFTRDGQINEALLRDRDARYRIDTAEIRQGRAGIPSPAVAPGANAWESGRTAQLERRTVQVRNLR